LPGGHAGHTPASVTDGERPQNALRPDRRICRQVGGAPEHWRRAQIHHYGGDTITLMPHCDVFVMRGLIVGKRLDQRELPGLQNLCWRPPRT